MHFSSEYTPRRQPFQWLFAVLVLAAFVMAHSGPEKSADSQAQECEQYVHSSISMLVLGLGVLRFLWRLGHRTRSHAAMPVWMLRAAMLGYGALYGLLFAVPLTAITGTRLEGHSGGMLLGLEIPPQRALDHSVGAWEYALHTWLGDAILRLAGLHAAVAIYHHRVQKDNTLLSMMPRRS